MRVNNIISLRLLMICISYSIITPIYCKVNTIQTLDSNIIIKKVIFTNGGGWPEIKQLPENNRYKLIIESNGRMILQWPGECPPSINNQLICFYKGQITLNEYKKISNQLFKMDFANLKELQLDYENQQPIKTEDQSRDTYEIYFNNSIKKILVENHDHTGLNQLKKMLNEIKLKTKWEPQ